MVSRELKVRPLNNFLRLSACLALTTLAGVGRIPVLANPAAVVPDPNTISPTTAIPAANDAMLAETHPVLKTSVFCGFEGRPIDPSCFKCLNPESPAYVTKPTRLWGNKFREAFRQAETEAAQGFCAMAIGRNSKEILDLIGKPLVRTGPVTNWSDSQEGEKKLAVLLGLQRAHGQSCNP